MKYMRCLLIILNLLLLSAGMSALAKESRTTICVYGLCLSDNVTKKRVVQKLGKGASVKRYDGVSGLCYFDPRAAIWVYFLFTDKETPGDKELLNGIMLTEQEMCSIKEGTLGISSKLTYPDHRIPIGATRASIIKALGNPVRIDDLKGLGAENPPYWKDSFYSEKFGDQVLVYYIENEIRTTFIYFKNNKVRSIRFLESE